MDMTFNCFVLHYHKNKERMVYLHQALREMPFYEVLTRYDREDIEKQLSDFYTASQQAGQERVNLMSDVLRFNEKLVGNARHKQGLGQDRETIYQNIRQGIASGSIPSIPYTAPSINNISLQLKHFEAWRITLSRPFTYTLVLEDDVILHEGSMAALQGLLKNVHLLNFDYIDLAGGSNMYPQGVFNEFSKGLYHIDPPSSRTTCAYLISKSLCEKLVTNGMDVLQPIDVDLNYFFRKFSANVFWAEPTMFIHGSEHGYYQTSIAR
jgi:hypothetical protein